jgi:hypothetical protein
VMGTIVRHFGQWIPASAGMTNMICGRDYFRLRGNDEHDLRARLFPPSRE